MTDFDAISEKLDELLAVRVTNPVMMETSELLLTAILFQLIQIKENTKRDCVSPDLFATDGTISPPRLPNKNPETN